MRTVVAIAILVALGCPGPQRPAREPAEPPVVIVGAGIAGLSAAVEAASLGARVVVIDRWSVFGGHAVASGGGVTMVATPVQAAAGIEDSPQLAAEDMLAWGEDADEHWVRRYATDSRAQVHDWLVAMGVVFERVSQLHGNRVARYHRTRDAGLGLVTPLFRNALALGVEFRWNEDVVDLVRDGARVVGVKTRGTRDGQERTQAASAVVLATGGFQSNLKRVRASWPAGQPQPSRLLAGSGVGSVGDGLDLAVRAGAALRYLDHQWNYATGIPDPRFPGTDRGLNAEVPQAIWVNTDGARFVNESAGTKVTFPALVAQPGSVAWAIVDADGVGSLAIAGPDWTDRARVERDILGNPAIVKRADDLDALARAIGVPAAALRATVEAHRASGASFQIARAPFFAIPRMALARKSMGGIAVDRETRVVDRHGAPIAGLYAVGEATGFATVNGRAALEGTFLGPSVLMGRIAGRAVPRVRSASSAVRTIDVTPARASFADSACTGCHPLSKLSASTPGRLHTAHAHRRVAAEALPCAGCHAQLYPYEQRYHRSDPLQRSETCGRCHLAQKLSR